MEMSLHFLETRTLPWVAIWHAAVFLLGLLLFTQLMTRRHRKTNEPGDLMAIDIEAASQPGSIRDLSTEPSDTEQRHRRRKRKYRRLSQPSNDTVEDADFWVVCPCVRCCKDDKPHIRLYSTVLQHIRQHLISNKYEV